MKERQAPQRNSFGRTKRLSKAAEYERVLKSADCVFRSGPLRISAKSSPRCGARLGMIVPKRIAHSSVRRNAIKRTIREWFRCNPTPGSLDIVVTLRSVPAETGTTSSTIRRSLRKWEQTIESTDGGS